MKEIRLQTGLLAVIAGLLMALVAEKPQPQRFVPMGNEMALDTKTGIACVAVRNPHPDAADPGPQCASVR